MNRYKDEYVELLGKRKQEIKQLWDNFYEEYPDGEYVQEKKVKKNYEEGIVVFVDGLHPQCSKTTAIALLQTSGVNIEFMNIKKKGLATTYIRLKSPEDAQKICEYFDVHPTVQETAKDTTGLEQETKTYDCLKLRVLTGKIICMNYIQLY